MAGNDDSVFNGKGENMLLMEHSISIRSDTSGKSSGKSSSLRTNRMITSSMAGVEHKKLDIWLKNELSLDCIQGRVAFHGITRNTMAQFLKLPLDDVKPKMDKVYKLMTEKWKIQKPNMVVSFTGRAKNFDIDNDVLLYIKDMIKDISEIAGAWLITGGTHIGVRKMVGDAISEKSGAVCVGITTWGIIKDREKLSTSRIPDYHVGAWLKNVNDEEAFLNPNHTHFLLIDDGTVGEPAKEIEFRTEFERHVTKTENAPHVLVVINGGVGTFKHVWDVVYGNTGTNDSAIALVEGSGGVADLLIDMINNWEDWSNWRERCLQVEEERLLERERLLEQLTKVPEVEDKWKQLFKMKGAEFVVVASYEDEMNVNEDIIDALCSIEQKKEGSSMVTMKYLQRSLLWDTPQNVKKMLPLNQPDTFCRRNNADDGGQELPLEQLEQLLIMALCRGNVKFVEMLLMEYELDIKEVLTIEKLALLYGYQSHENNFPRFSYGKLEYDNVNATNLNVLVKDIYTFSTNWEYYSKGDCLLSIKEINRLRNQKFASSIDIDDVGNKELKDKPFFELFIWATICNLPLMAKFFWPLERNQIAKALLASQFWGQLALEEGRYDELKIRSFNESHDGFKKYATDLLDQCYEKDEEKTRKVITTTLNLHDDEKDQTTCLEMAVDHKNQEFVAHSCVQNVLTDVWTGKMQIPGLNFVDYIKIVISFCCPILINILFSFQVSENEKKEGKGKVSCFDPEYWINIKGFYLSTPAVRFVVHLVAQLIFISIYVFVVLKKRINRENLNDPSTSEILLYAYASGFLTTEIYQITRYRETTVIRKLARWICDKYNVCDAILLTLFIIATGLRWTVETITFSHTIHSINCGLWIWRLSTLFRVDRVFGRIFTMLGGLKDFIVVFVVSMLSHKLASTGFIFPVREKSEELITALIIALFNTCYNSVTQQDSKSWKYERYHLIDEYAQHLPIPTPLCVPLHLCYFIYDFSHKMLKLKKKPREKWTSEELKGSRKQKGNLASEKEDLELMQFECVNAMSVYKKLGGSTIRRKPKADKEVKVAGLGDMTDELNNMLKEFIQRERDERKPASEPINERGRKISQFPNTKLLDAI